MVGSGCLADNIPGRLGADKQGDLSNPSAERRDSRLELAQACGQPDGASIPYTFLRAPYLQRVTAASAELSWVSTTDPDPALILSGTDGTVLNDLRAASDQTATLPLGTSQWSTPLGPLAPNTIYCYDVRSNSAASERLGFRTAPAPGSGNPVRFIAFGDSGGGGDDQRALRDQMATVPFDLMLHTGDIAYGSGTRAELQERFFDVYANLLKYVPAFPASGNHDYDTDDANPFREAFVLPENGAPDGLERWYSFDWGDVHFVALDTERTGPVQAAWLDNDLSANKLPWTIVYGHRPPFSSGEHGSDGAFQTYFVPVLERHQVPLVLNGHDHDYERTKPMNGVTYVVTGGGGIGVRPVGTSNFTAFSDAVIHFVYVVVSGNQLALHAIDGLGNEFDSLVIAR